MEHDVDALVEESRTAVNKMGEQRLWKAVLALPEWYFVADQPGDEGEPLIATIEGHPYVLAFTDEERASAFAASRAARKGEPAAPVLSMEVADAVGYLRSLIDHNVIGAHFNNGKYSFGASTEKLIDMHGRYT